MYNQQGKMAGNWYSKTKTADATSSTGSEGRLPSEGNLQEMTGVKKMVYRNPGDPSLVRLGDLFRSKANGIAFNSGKDDVYKVVAKTKTHVVLEGNDKKKFHIEIGIELPAKFVKV